MLVIFDEPTDELLESTGGGLDVNEFTGPGADVSTKLFVESDKFESDEIEPGVRFIEYDTFTAGVSVRLYTAERNNSSVELVEVEAFDGDGVDKPLLLVALCISGVLDEISVHSRYTMYIRIIVHVGKAIKLMHSMVA